MRRTVVTFLIIQCTIYLDQSSGDPLIGRRVRVANEGQFPFAVSINNRTKPTDIKHICTGTLISPKHVLTAYVCLFNFALGKEHPYHQFYVLIGSKDLLQPQQRIEIESWSNYAKWAYKKNMSTHRHIKDDLAVITLKEIAVGVTPVKLSNLTYSELLDKEVTLAGWGLSNTGFKPRILLHAKVTVISHAFCLLRIKHFNPSAILNKRRYFCTYSIPYALLTLGDYGGPLIIGKNKEMIGVNVNTYLEDIDIFQTSRSSSETNIHASIEFFKPFIRAVAKI